MEAEQELTGGNMNRVMRAGGTVRRQAGPWSARVQQLLSHLRAAGIQEVPAPLGFDEQGREILSFLPGQAGLLPTPDLLNEAVLSDAARLLRRIHDASAPVAAAWTDGWQAVPRPPVEVICHGDFAPYNCIFEDGQLAGVIDFDHAHPGSRAWDLAYALYRFAPLHAPSNPDHFGSFTEQCQRARLFCAAYGLNERAALAPVILRRVAAMAEFLRACAARGDARILANIADGHLEIYLNDYAYLEARKAELAQALAE